MCSRMHIGLCWHTALHPLTSPGALRPHHHLILAAAHFLSHRGQIRLFNQGTQFPAHPPLQETSARLTMTSPVPFTTSTHCPNVAPQHQIPHSLAPRPQCWSLLVLPSQYLSLQRSLILGNILGHIRKLSDGGVGTFYAYFHCQPYTLLTVIRASPYNQQWVAETTHRPSTLTQYAQASPPV